MSPEEAARLAAFVLFYFTIGFGPGFVVGLAIGNFFAARDESTIRDKQWEDVKKATAHNKQWDPSHERWQSRR